MPLMDQWGRRVTRLRLAVSDTCNLQCRYCRPREAASGGALLTRGEIAAIASAAVGLGIGTLRLTGGEPLLRPDLPDIVGDLAALHPNVEVALTTNGSLLRELARPLARAGLRRVNVSVDSLRGMDGALPTDEMQAGLAAARQAGLDPIKLNTVVIRGGNDAEVGELVAFAREHGCHPRFIEYMPLDGESRWQPRELVPVAEIRGRIETQVALTPLPDSDGPGDEYLVEGGPTRLTLIGAVTHPFCRRCNRLRVTADGFLRSCLFSQDEHNLRQALAAPRPGEALVAVFRAAVAGKPQGHRIGEPGFVPPRRSMFAIGG
jgi:GTP 3',8-cyclase